MINSGRTVLCNWVRRSFNTLKMCCCLSTRTTATAGGRSYTGLIGSACFGRRALLNSSTSSIEGRCQLLQCIPINSWSAVARSVALTSISIFGGIKNALSTYPWPRGIRISSLRRNFQEMGSGLLPLEEISVRNLFRYSTGRMKRPSPSDLLRTSYLKRFCSILTIRRNCALLDWAWSVSTEFRKSWW